MLLALSLITAHAAEIEPYAMGQVWITAYDMDVNQQGDPAGYGDPEDDPGFKLRRARAGLVKPPELGSEPIDRVGFSVILGMSSGPDPLASANFSGIGLVDATFSVQATETVVIGAGLTKVPFGRENQFSSLELPFQERSVQSNHLVSLREVGVTAQYNAPFGLRLQGGVFNGNGSLVGDQDPNMLFAGRADFTVLGDQVDAYRTFGAVDAPVLGIGADFNMNMEAATNTMVTGGDVIFRVKGLTVLGEGHMSRISIQNSTITAPGVLADTTRWGALAQVGYTIGDRWEPVARWEIYDESTALSDNGDLMHVYAGLNTHWLDDHLRVGAGYVMRMERGGASVPNDTVRIWTQFNL
jgi:hypothetical protein